MFTHEKHHKQRAGVMQRQMYCSLPYNLDVPSCVPMPAHCLLEEHERAMHMRTLPRLGCTTERKKERNEGERSSNEGANFIFLWISSYIFLISLTEKSRQASKRIEEDCTSHCCFIILYGCLSISGFNVSFQDKLNLSPETPFHAVFTATFCGESLWKSVLSV